jgi:branched-chain amino acid transport system substrate-binding protein
MKSYRYPVVITLFLILSLAFGCKERPAAVSGTSRTGTTPAAPQQVVLGSILGLTGDNASYGQKMQRGFEFARQERSDAGNAKFDLHIEDSQFDPTKAVTAYRKLTSADGAKIIVGITGSKNAIPVCEAAKSDTVVIVDALSSAPKISTTCGQNYFRIMASDALAGKYNAKWAADQGAKKVAIVFMEDDWGTSYRDSLVRYLGEQRLSNPTVIGVVAKSRDFRGQVQQIKAARPDAIFLLLYASEGAAFMQQLRQAGMKAAVYGSDNISSPEFAVAGADVVEGVRVAMPAPTKGAAYDAFVGRYKAKFHEEPDANVIKSYDTLNLIADAVKKAGPDPAAVATYLHSPTYSYEGVSGTVRFEPNGDLASQEYTRTVYRGGKLVPFDGR